MSATVTTSSHCSEGDILPGTPAGTLTDDGAYLAAAPSPSARAIVYLTDVFGLPLKNCKITSDNLSKRLGCDVYIPDIFNGVSTNIPSRQVVASMDPVEAGVKPSIWQNIRLIWRAITRLPLLIGNRSSVVDGRIDNFIKKIREDKKYEKIGAVGYCFGGACAGRLGAKNLVDSIVINHPGGLSLAEVKVIRVPTSWAMAEDDLFFPTTAQHKAEAIFAGRKDKDDFVEYEFRQYKGTAHGFAARPVLSNPEVMAGYEGAFEQAVEWFNKTIPVETDISVRSHAEHSVLNPEA